MKVLPKSDWLLVRCDPFQSRSDVIHTLNDNQSRMRTGTVLAVGPGRPSKETNIRLPVGIEPGEKIAFLRWHMEHRPGKEVVQALFELSKEEGADVCLIREADVLIAYTGDVKVDIP